MSQLDSDGDRNLDENDSMSDFDMENSSSIKKEKVGQKKGFQVSSGRKGKKIANCWTHFTEYMTKDGQKRCRCNHCGSSYAFNSSSSTTNMNTHLKKRCKKYKPTVEENQTFLVKQPNVEGEGSSLGISRFNAEDCRKGLLEMLILDELPFRFVENKGFRKFCQVICPRFDVPSRRTIVRDLYKLYLDEKTSLKKYFKKSKVRVCLTTDTWTSIQNINYMVVTAHFVDSEWRLQKRILSFSQITDHKGESIGKCVEKVLLEWGIDKVFTITVDNAIANATAISYVTRKLNSWQADGTILGGKYLHVRCCAHILNLIVGDGLRDLHDSVAAIRNAVKYVKSSPSRLDRFKQCVEHEKIGSKGLVVLDVPTRWNSTFLMLQSAVKLKKAFERLEEEDGHYVNYFKESENGKMRTGPPTSVDWENAKVFIHFLEIFYDITLDFSASLRVTSNIYFKSWCTIFNQLTSLSTVRDPLVCQMALSMKQKFDKYWGSLEKTNILLIISVVLDPRFKLGYVKFRYDSFYGVQKSETMIASLKASLIELYECYEGLYGNVVTSEVHVDFNCDDVPSLGCDGSNTFLEKEKYKEDDLWDRIQREANVDVTRSEVDLYLLEACQKRNDMFDILAWWKKSRKKFPILSMIARDVLAMPLSTVASEAAFSTGGHILDPFRSSLTPKMVEGLILTQNWLDASCPISEPYVLEEHARNEDTSIPVLEHYTDVVSDLENGTPSIALHED